MIIIGQKNGRREKGKSKVANRNMQQKMLKNTRLRRAWAKKYSMKGTGLAPLPGYMGDDGKFKSMSLGSRTTAARSVINEWLNAKFGKPSSVNEIYARRAGLHGDMIVLGKLVQSQSGAGTLQGEQQYVFHMVVDTDRHKLMLVMGGNDCFFLDRTLWPSHGVVVYRRSVSYTQRQLAMRAYLRDKEEPYSHITWEKKTQEALTAPRSG